MSTGIFRDGRRTPCFPDMTSEIGVSMIYVLGNRINTVHVSTMKKPAKSFSGNPSAAIKTTTAANKPPYNPVDINRTISPHFSQKEMHRLPEVW